MKNTKKTARKLAVTLGSVLALSAAGIGGCGMADTENDTEYTSQTATADIQDSEAESDPLPEACTEPLPDENNEYRKVTSESGGEAYFGSHTTVILDGETFDIKDRDDCVNAITDIKAVGGYWLVKGHISPNIGYYGFYNTQTRQWDREFFGALLTWYGADEADTDIPFSMDNVVYEAWNSLYDSNGTLLRTIELDESEYEYIHDLKCVGTGVEVYILNAEMKERTVLVNDILQTE